MNDTPRDLNDRASSLGRLGQLSQVAVRRPRQVVQVLQRDGARLVLGNALARGSQRLLSGAQPFDLDVRLVDVLAPAEPERPSTRPDGASLVINFVANPPDEQSGGMSTLMRTVSLLEARGHDCRVYVLYKGLRRDLDRHREIARERWPAVRAQFDDVAAGMRPADAIFATAWPTAYLIRAAATPGTRFYLVQDFEPVFYPASSNAALAEETYRFGFHGITAGRWLTGKLDREYGMHADSFDLGVDLDCYRYDEHTRRNGVVYYARPDTPRRGFELGMLALEMFSRRHPEIEIHLIGQQIRWRRPSFPFVNHGHLTPAELAAVYNRCAAGLVLSLTNISLLPAELLAAGCIPVMNDAENTRASFDNPYAVFSGARPDELADALCDVVESPDGDDRRAKAAASVGPLSWDLVADQLEAGIRRGLAIAHP